MYISSVSLPISVPYQTLVSLRQSILCGYDNVTFVCFFCFLLFFFGGGWGLAVKLLTGFEAFGPPVKDFALAVSVVILDGASLFRYLRV